MSCGILAASVLLVVPGGCGGGGSPEAVVKDFAAAYGDRDIQKACGYYELQGHGSMTEALEEAAVDDRAAMAELGDRLGAVEDESGICPANLALIRDWDPEPGRIVDMKVRDVDEDGEDATVNTSEGEWTLHESDGDWKLSNVDPAIPADLEPR